MEEPEEGLPEDDEPEEGLEEEDEPEPEEGFFSSYFVPMAMISFCASATMVSSTTS